MSTGSWSGLRSSGRRAPWSIPDVAPFAPGKVPNMLSKVRFSLIRNTTCLIGHRVLTESASNLCGRVEGSSGGASGPGGVGVDRSTHEAAIASTRSAAKTPRRRNTSGDAIGGASGTCSVDELVTEPANRDEVNGLVRVSLDLATEALHVDVEGLGV